MNVRNKLYCAYHIFYILLFPLCSFAQSEGNKPNSITPNDRRYAWVFDMVETALLYEKEDSSIYKIDNYYEKCLNKKVKTLPNCEICAQYSLTKWDYFVDSLFTKAYRLSSKNYKYQNMMNDMNTKWLQLRKDIKVQRTVLASKMALTPKNYILLYSQEIVMIRTYAKFLESLSFYEK